MYGAECVTDTANVIHVDFTPGEYGQGKARCLGCRHEWQAVVPVGTTQLDCPECGAWKGVLLGEYVPELAWECECGCSLFYLTQDGQMCPNCGLYADQPGDAS